MAVSCTLCKLFSWTGYSCYSCNRLEKSKFETARNYLPSLDIIPLTPPKVKPRVTQRPITFSPRYGQCFLGTRYRPSTRTSLYYFQRNFQFLSFYFFSNVFLLIFFVTEIGRKYRPPAAMTPTKRQGSSGKPEQSSIRRNLTSPRRENAAGEDDDDGDGDDKNRRRGKHNSDSSEPFEKDEEESDEGEESDRTGQEDGKAKHDDDGSEDLVSVRYS